MNIILYENIIAQYDNIFALVFIYQMRLPRRSAPRNDISDTMKQNQLKEIAASPGPCHCEELVTKQSHISLQKRKGYPLGNL
jgi:hypothetical protein